MSKIENFECYQWIDSIRRISLEKVMKANEMDDELRKTQERACAAIQYDAVGIGMCSV
jgi:hypothetical protein